MLSVFFCLRARLEVVLSASLYTSVILSKLRATNGSEGAPKDPGTLFPFRSASGVLTRHPSSASILDRSTISLSRFHHRLGASPSRSFADESAAFSGCARFRPVEERPFGAARRPSIISSALSPRRGTPQSVAGHGSARNPRIKIIPCCRRLARSEAERYVLGI
jgi:hypothetical protein